MTNTSKYFKRNTSCRCCPRLWQIFKSILKEILFVGVAPGYNKCLFSSVNRVIDHHLSLVLGQQEILRRKKTNIDHDTWEYFWETINFLLTPLWPSSQAPKMLLFQDNCWRTCQVYPSMHNQSSFKNIQVSPNSLSIGRTYSGQLLDHWDWCLPISVKSIV